MNELGKNKEKAKEHLKEVKQKNLILLYDAKDKDKIKPISSPVCYMDQFPEYFEGEAEEMEINKDENNLSGPPLTRAFRNHNSESINLYWRISA